MIDHELLLETLEAARKLAEDPSDENLDKAEKISMKYHEQDALRTLAEEEEEVWRDLSFVIQEVWEARRTNKALLTMPVDIPRFEIVVKRPDHALPVVTKLTHQQAVQICNAVPRVFLNVLQQMEKGIKPDPSIGLPEDLDEAKFIVKDTLSSFGFCNA